MFYTVEYGDGSRKVHEVDLNTRDALARFYALKAAGAEKVRIIDKRGEQVEPHYLDLAIRGVRFG